MANIFSKKKLSGVSLKSHKNTNHSETKTIPVPDEVVLSMSQHMGAPCNPIVKVGETVFVGQMIGETANKAGPPIHASVSGVVTDIREIKSLDGFSVQSVVIRADKAQTPCAALVKPVVGSKEDFLKAVYESGLVGLGGAGFPTHRKLDIKKGRAKALLINAAECEPYITSDNREMLESAVDIIEGIKLVCGHLNIGSAVIGIERNKPDAIDLIKCLCENETGISVKVLPSIYPQGAEKALIYSLTGKVVPENALPIDVGVIVMNVTSIAELSRYFKTGMPLVSRRITVDGNLVERPGNIRVPIGTKVSDIIEFCGSKGERPDKLLFGGPMMGMTVTETKSPVLKTTNAVLAFNHHVEADTKTTACIHCGKCILVCPVDLMPVELEKAHDKVSIEDLKELSVNLCINCGCCSYICPAKRKLTEKHQVSKKMLAASEHKGG